MAATSKCIGQRVRSWFMARQQQPMRKQDTRCRPQLEVLEDRNLLSATTAIGDVFYIDMENHNLTQPSGLTGSPEQLLGNPAAPYLNSLITPGNTNAAQTSYASNYLNAAPGNHPSLPNYLWQEQGTNNGVFNDNTPFGVGGVNQGNAPSLSGLLQAAGIPWKSYQEDIDLTPTSGSVNQPGANALTSTVAPQSQWTVPLNNFSGTSSAYTNPYNGSNQYNFATKHDGQLYFNATNGGDNTTPSNPESQYYAPLQQLQTDLNNNTVAQYNLITPDQYNDMHTPLTAGFAGYTGDQAAVAQGDNFLSIIIPKIEASQAYKNNGAIVIWFDETEGGDTSAYTLAEIVISPLAKGNAYDSTLLYTHSSDLKTLQEVFGVQAPGGGFLGGANTPGTNDLSDLFVPGVFNTSTLGGTLFKNSGNNHKVVAGQTIVLTGINDANQVVNLTATTGADGSYTFTGLLPGAYTVTVQGAEKDIGIGGITLGVGQTLSEEDFSLLGPNSKQLGDKAGGIDASISSSVDTGDVLF